MRSKLDMNSTNIELNKKKIRSMLIEVLKKTETYTKEECDDIAFHMTDWLDNFIELFEVYRNPHKHNHKKIKDILDSFLVHVPNHVAAASKLLLDQGISDIWQNKAR